MDDGNGGGAAIKGAAEDRSRECLRKGQPRPTAKL